MGGTAPLDGAAALDILRSLPLAVTVIDDDGRFRFVNDAAAALFGAAADELIGGQAVTLTVGASETPAAIELAAAVQANEPWMGRFPLTGPDGRRLDAWFASTAVAGEMVSVGGDARRISATLGADDGDDLVERSFADAEAANQLLTTLLDAVPVGMAFFDRDARMVRVNRALTDIHGVSPEDHIGSRLADVLPGIPDSVDDAIQRVFATGETMSDRLVTGETPREPGVERHWIVSLFPVRLRGVITWVGSAAVEVTDWRRNEEERARLLTAEQAARHAAEEAAQRLARLQVVTARLAEATSARRVADVILTNGTDGLGATGAALVVATADGQALEVVAATGYAREAVEAYQRFGIDADVPAAEAARRRELIWIPTLEERNARWPGLRNVTTFSESSLALPLVLEDTVLGAITMGWSSPRELSDADRDFLFAIGRQCVLALERVRLYEAERAARDAAEVARERMAFLAEASRILGSSLDHTATLMGLANLAVRSIADVCTVHLMGDDGLQLVGAVHREPAKSDLLRRVTTWPVREARLFGRVAASGEMRLIDDVTSDVVEAIAQDQAHERLIEELELGSIAIVPLVVSGRVLGLLSLGSVAGTRRYRQDDREFVEDLAARVAAALQNALTHAARTEVARMLQQTLLPPIQPTIPGLDIAQRYHSAGEIDVGGDFFDVFPSGDGRWGVVMGDVCGRGVAAASLTALARYTVRAGAIDEGEPTQVLRLVNRAILDTETGERFCTIVHAVVEPGAGGARVVLACGGHPLPLVVRCDGHVEEVGIPGTAIGLFEELDITEVETELRPGDAIVFYTDGLTEARAPDGRFAPDLLATVLSGAAGSTAEHLAEAVDRAVLAFEGGQARDDMALLILRVPRT